jgi:hypothetical protein
MTGGEGTRGLHRSLSRSLQMLSVPLACFAERADPGVGDVGGLPAYGPDSQPPHLADPAAASR